VNGGIAIKLFAWAIALGLVVLPVVGVLGGWFASDRWPITRLDVRAEFNHVTAEQIQAAAQPMLGGGFFAVKLDAVRDAVAKLPWVARAEARKRWPDAIDLVVYEQQPYARWGKGRLVNRQGGIFTVAGTEGLQGLPRLDGPDDRLGDVLHFYSQCLGEFTGSGLVIEAVTLSPRGGWRIGLASGATIEVGRDNPEERLKRFLDVWPRLGTANGAPGYVDLRYENGFAVRWAAAPPAGGNGESGMGNGQARRAADGTMPIARIAIARDGTGSVPRVPESAAATAFAFQPIPLESGYAATFRPLHSPFPIPHSRLQ
jgi:cell division protein FtsQ